MTFADLHRKVETLEKALLQMRFQLERLTSKAPVDTTVCFSAKQFAALIGRTPDWVRCEIAAGRIKAYGPPYLIPGSEIARFV